MSKEPVVYRPRTLQQILLFVILIVWSYASVEVASYLLVTLYSNQALWIIFTSVVLLPLAIPIWIAARWLKQTVSYEEVPWDFHTQELSFKTYSKMMADYASGYTHLISRIDYRLLLLAVLVLITAISLPIPLVGISVLLLFYFPYAFGALALGYGILLSIFFYRASTNEVTNQFVYENPQTFRIALTLLESIPGLNWIGIRFQMGMAGGYYAIHNSRAVGRIRGIEAVARIEITVGGVDPPLTAFGFVSSSESEESKRMMELDAPEDEIVQLIDLVNWCITLYIRDHGSNEILDEVLTDLKIRTANSKSRID